MPYLGSYVLDPDSDADPEPATPGTNFRECRRDALMLVPKGRGSISPLVDRSEEIPPDDADCDPAWEQLAALLINGDSFPERAMVQGFAVYLHTRGGLTPPQRRRLDRMHAPAFAAHLARVCEVCGAEPGAECTGPEGVRTNPHPERIAGRRMSDLRPPSPELLEQLRAMVFDGPTARTVQPLQPALFSEMDATMRAFVARWDKAKTCFRFARNRDAGKIVREHIADLERFAASDSLHRCSDEDSGHGAFFSRP